MTITRHNAGPRMSAAIVHGNTVYVAGQVSGDAPTVKGQTAASSYKPAVLSNGVRTMVPPFVGPGTKIVVMTADGSYVERAK